MAWRRRIAASADGLAPPGKVWYTACVQETITIRPTVPKAKLEKLSGGNLNKWINGLIERAVGEQNESWDEFLRQPRRKFKYMADEVRKAGR